MSGEADSRRHIPSMDALLRAAEARGWSHRWGRSRVGEALRSATDSMREGTAPGPGPAGGEPVEALLDLASRLLEQDASPSLRRVINATGVVLHTNLGRAPLAAEALRAVRETAGGYATLEYDVDAGRRGDRQDHCGERITALTGSEAALVVNNAAAALVLAVNELARDRKVVVSRGELVEIGGSFRLPEIIAAAGGLLAEVGTTNRTRIEDYAKALADGDVAMLLKVHPSNYRLQGFTEEASLGEIVRLGTDSGVPVVHDLGSGLLEPSVVPALPEEPSPAASIRAGADLVLWSGDKLLGGPQAGILHGRRDIVDRLRSNPLLRALRPGRMTLAALEATLLLHARPESAGESVPALRLLRAGSSEIEARARAARELLSSGPRHRVRVLPLASLVGGGAFPGIEIASAGWRVEGPAPVLDSMCRAARPPLVGRVQDGAYHLDFRTVLAGEDVEVARIVDEALTALERPAGDPSR